MSIARSLLLRASQSHWLAAQVPRYPFARRAVRRFMPGERAEDALAECSVLAAAGMTSVITRLGENIRDAGEAAAVTQHYLAVLADIQQGALPTQISVKLTQLGLDTDEATAVRNVTALMRAAGPSPVWVDMEGSAYTDATIAVFDAARANAANVGLCIQAYLRRTDADLTALLDRTTAIRLVKGAYQEPASIAYARKSDVDRNYLVLAHRMLERARHGVLGHVPAFATHDVALIREIARAADRAGLARDGYEFQMLYGINTTEQRRLAAEGYRVRVLISYGEAWFAWYMRRLAERPANVWFLLKNLV